MSNKKKLKTEPELIQAMYAIVDFCYVAAGDWSYERWATEANLSPATIHYLVNRKTRYPRFLTIQKMAQAVGIQVTAKEQGHELSIYKAA
jgi:hypothetical protein